jgi:hypothetical protein
MQEICGSFDSDAMVESIKSLDQELIALKNALTMTTLKPLPGETVNKNIIII